MNPRILLVAPVPPPYGGMALQAGQLAQLLSDEGHPVNLFPSNFKCPSWIDSTPGMRTIYRWLAIWPRLWKAAKGADVMHILAASWFYFFAVVYPAVLVGRLRGIRVVVNYRGGEAADFFGSFGFLVGPALHLAHCISAPSAFLAQIIERRFRLPVLIVPNILNRSKFRFRERGSFAPRLLVTRHLEEIYDIPTVLRAFGLVQKRYPDAVLTVAGTGNQAAALPRLAEQLGLRNVRFAGPIEHSRLAAIYDEHDIYINASRVDNFPGALLEASSAGLPVVTTAAGGIPHIYTHDTSALLVPVGEQKALAESVERLVADPELGRRLVQEALRVVDGCQWDRVRPQLYRSYGMQSPHQPSGEVVTELHG